MRESSSRSNSKIVEEQTSRGFRVSLTRLSFVSKLLPNLESSPLAVPTESVGWLDTSPPADANNRSLILFDTGDEVVVQAGEDGIRFLLVSGKPLQEPVAWYGPIVMNTQEQLQKAYKELQEGTFLKK